ncbi:hypothetical protein PG996_015815 [Apiospora saccharicola]|uniref:CFEM domain-containing protein n=1 Tax=Apiospora saccharicola TaxID=335842 RepID=A0ABR1TPH3_9PEZI
MRALISSSSPSSPSPWLLAGSLLLAAARPAAALTNDFSSYPSGSQDCLTQAADGSKCSGSTGQQVNECLCTNKGNFVYNTASCVAKASPGDLNAVYATLSSNCAGTGVTLSVSQDAFLAQAAAATAVTTTSSAKPTKTDDDPTTTTTNDPNNPSPTSTTAAADRSSWSSTAKVGVGVGIGVGASALILVGGLLWRRYRRKKQWNQGGGQPGVGPNGEPGMAPMGGGREYHHQPGVPHAPGPRPTWAAPTAANPPWPAPSRCSTRAAPTPTASGTSRPSAR